MTVPMLPGRGMMKRVADDDFRWDELPVELARKWLEKSGCQVAFREAGWFECLLTARNETWFGAGTSSDAALRDAIGKAFPSAASRLALFLAVADKAPGMSTEEERLDEVPPTTRSIPDLIVDAPVEMVDAASEETPEADQPVAASTAEMEELSDGQGTIPAEVVVENTSGEAVVEETSEKPDEPAAAIVPLEQPQPKYRSLVEIDEALAELQGLQELIAESEEELALLAPERQRLHMQIWVCEARTYEEIHRGDEQIYNAVSRVVKQLAMMAKVFWPGSINTMRADASPEVVMTDHRLKGTKPRSWWEAREIVQVADEAAVTADSEVECDEYGWVDAGALLPGPNAAPALLLEIRSRLEKWSGSLGKKPDFKGGSLPLPPDNKTVGEAVTMARKVRWLRLAVPDEDLLWGQIIGRLRAIAAKWRTRFNGPLLTVLDPTYTPRRTWALELGIDPSKRQKQRRRVALFGRFETAATLGLDELTELVQEGLGTFSSAELVALFQGARSNVLLVPAEALDTRSHRRRLNTIKKRLQETESTDTDAIEVVEAIRHEAEEGVANADDGTGEEDPMEALVLRIREQTDGKRALLVSNRKDIELAEQLRIRLGFEEVGIAECTPRRVDSAAQAIGKGSIDFVLSVTGFLPHTTDGTIADACRRSGTRLVRIGKGRPLAAIRALGRVLRVD